MRRQTGWPNRCEWLSLTVLHKTRPHVCAGGRIRLVHKPPACMHRYYADDPRHKSRQSWRCRYKQKWQGAGQEKRGRQRRHPTIRAPSRSLSGCLGPTRNAGTQRQPDASQVPDARKKASRAVSRQEPREGSTVPHPRLYCLLGTCILSLQQDQLTIPAPPHIQEPGTTPRPTLYKPANQRPSAIPELAQRWQPPTIKQPSPKPGFRVQPTTGRLLTKCSPGARHGVSGRPGYAGPFVANAQSCSAAKKKSSSKAPSIRHGTLNHAMCRAGTFPLPRRPVA